MLINIEEFKSIGKQWSALYVNANNMTYFDSFGVECIPKEIKKIMESKNIRNINRIQAFDSIICGYFCNGFIDFMWKGKSLLDYANFLTPNDYEKDDKIIKVKMRKIYCTKCNKCKDFKKPKISYICKKALYLSSICNKCGSEDGSVKEEKSIGISKTLGLITSKIRVKNLDQKNRRNKKLFPWRNEAK